MRMRRQSSPGYDAAFYMPRISPFLSSASIAQAGGVEMQIFMVSPRGRPSCESSPARFKLPGYLIPRSTDDVNITLRPPYQARRRLGKLRETFTLCRTVPASDAEVVTWTAGPHVGLAGWDEQATEG